MKGKSNPQSKTGSAKTSKMAGEGGEGGECGEMQHSEKMCCGKAMKGMK